MVDAEEIRGAATLLLRQMSGHDVRQCVDGFLKLISRSPDRLTEVAQAIFEEALSSISASVMCADLVYTLARSFEYDYVRSRVGTAFLKIFRYELEPHRDVEPLADAGFKAKAERRCASAQFLGRLFNRGQIHARIVTIAFFALAGESGSIPCEQSIMGACDLLQVVGHVCTLQPASSLSRRFDEALTRLDELSRATDVDGSSVCSLQALDRINEIMNFQLVGWPSEPKLVLQVQEILHNGAAHVRATLLSGETCALVPGSLSDLKPDDIRESIASHMGVHMGRLRVTQTCCNCKKVESCDSMSSTDASVFRFLPVMGFKGKIILDYLEGTTYRTKRMVYYRRSANYCDEDLTIAAVQPGVLVSGSLETDDFIKVSVAT